MNKEWHKTKARTQKKARRTNFSEAVNAVKRGRLKVLTNNLPKSTANGSSTATGPDKVAYPMLKHLPRYGMDFLLHIFNLYLSLHSCPSICKTSFIPILVYNIEKPLDSFASFGSISTPLASQNVLKASFYRVYFFF